MEGAAAAVRARAAELRADREVVLAAVTESPNAIEHVSPTLWGDREILLLGVPTGYCLRDKEHVSDAELLGQLKYVFSEEDMVEVMARLQANPEQRLGPDTD